MPERGEREALPGRRETARAKVRVGGFRGYADVGFYADGRPGEVFIDTSRQGTELRGIYAALAHAVSLGLQYGVPMSVFIDAFTHAKFGERGRIEGQPELGTASSPLDALFRSIAAECNLPLPPEPGEPL